MPSVTALGQSLVLVEGGWKPVSSLAPSDQIGGVNRFGQITSEPIAITAQTEINEGIAVGTSRAFGIFHSKTSLLLSGGDSVEAGDCIKWKSISDFSFEHALLPACSHVGRVEATSHLWDALHRRALWCTSEELIVRFCVQAADALVPYRGVSGVAGTVLLFKKDQFLSNFDGTWHQAFEIAAPIFHDFTNDQMSFTVAESCLSANYATNAKTVGRFKFNYDSKQHTVQVFVTETDKNSSPIVTGETAFRIVDLFESVELNWDQKGWRPLISGFIASKS